MGTEIYNKALTNLLRGEQGKDARSYRGPSPDSLAPLSASSFIEHMTLGELVAYLRFADSISSEALRRIALAVEQAPAGEYEPSSKAPALKEQAACLLKIRKAVSLFCGSSAEDAGTSHKLNDDPIIRLTFMKFAKEVARRGMVQGVEPMITQETFTFWWEALERGDSLPKGGGLDYDFFAKGVRFAAKAGSSWVEQADVREVVKYLSSEGWDSEPWLKEVQEALWERLADRISVLGEVEDLPLHLKILKNTRHSTHLVCRACEAAASIMKQPISGELLEDARETFKDVLQTRYVPNSLGDYLPRLKRAARKGLDRANKLVYGKLIGSLQNIRERWFGGYNAWIDLS